MNEELRATMRLGWGGPTLLSNPAAMMRFIPAAEEWDLPHGMKLKRRNRCKERQLMVHSLWSCGLRREARRLYWFGKLKRKGAR